MSQKLIKALRGLVAVVLMLFATNFLPVAATFATPVGPVVEWGQQGRDKADPNCLPGQTANFHFILAGAGTDITNPGTLNVTFSPSGSDSDAGTLHAANGNSKASATYNVSGAYDSVATTATVTGATWTVGNGNNDTPILTLSGSSCTGTPTPEDTVITPPTLHTDVVCGPSNDVTTLVNSSDSAHYTVSHVGNVYTVTANSGYTFSTGKTVTLNVPADANTVCPNIVITPPTLHTDVVCGPNNDITTLVDSADSAHYMVSHQGNVYTVTAKDGYTFSSGKTVTLTAPTDTNTSCIPVDVCKNIPGNQATVPEGMTVNDKGICKNVKVFVCKYVGTPGVNERLKEGKNPISVSVKSTGGAAVGSSFNDKQGRSFVLGIDDGNFHPTRENCPPTEGPTVITPPTLHTDVVCGPNNDTTTLVDSADKAHYTVSHQGNVYTVTANSGFTFSNGNSVTLTVPTDANTVCPPTDVCPNVPGTQTSRDECGSVEGATDVCPNIAGDQATVPAGMTKDATTGNCITTTVTGGQGGDVLGATTTAAAPQLANTGQSPWAAIIVGITVLGLTLSSAFVSRKQRLEA